MSLSDRLAVGAATAFCRSGSIDLTLPDGSTHRVGPGSASGAVSADITIRDRSAYRAIVREGTLGFLEAYVRGAVTTTDLRRLMLWAAANHAKTTKTFLGRLAGPVRSVWQRIAPLRGHQRVATMADHYNLGNDFYATWLDPTMTYSSARFDTPHGSLEEAQIRKYAAIADHAALHPGMRVLEIGCGWGGFATYAARECGVDVVGLTIAQEQADHARKRASEEGLASAVDIRMEDFRAHEGTYDAIISIEMIESVDETVWPALFAAFHDRLRPGGRAVLQAIVIEDSRFEGYRRRQDFIQRYIFPGGQVPSAAIIERLAAEHGLTVESRELFGLDYARTLHHWFDRFVAAWPELENSGFDERFRRIWELYLTYCEAGFRAGTIDVGQWTFTAR